MTVADEPIRVVLVEDNQILREELSFQFDLEGFDVRTANDAHELAQLLQVAPCDVLILDINLPGENGFSIARRLTARDRMGIIIMSARDQLQDKLMGLESGADLYLVKPVDRREVTACIRTLVRRVKPAQDGRTSWLFLKHLRQLQAPDGRSLILTPQDARVFTVLAERAGETCARSDVVAALGIEFLDSPDGRTNTTISRLRSKLMAFDDQLGIVAWRNEGYAYVGPAVQIRAA